MDRRLRRSSLRFASVMSGIVEKYNFPFDDDMVVSIKSLTYSTPDGPKVWGEESSLESKDTSCQNLNKAAESQSTEIQRQQTSENEDDTAYESFEEQQFTDSSGDHQLTADHKSNAALNCIKRHLENIHIKENIPLVCYSETPVKNYRVPMDMLLEDCTTSIPKVHTVTRIRTRNIHQSPLQQLDNNSSTGDHHDVFWKRMSSIDEPPTLLSLQLSNSSASSSANGIVERGNSSLWGGNEKDLSSFLEMYESADEHCSWSNVTIADLYPGMVKALSRLLHKASSSSLTRQYKYGYWHKKKTKLNTTTERIRNYTRLKSKSNLTVTKGDQKKHKLSVATDESGCPFDDGKHQIECSANNLTRTVSLICSDADVMEIDSPGILEDISHTKKVRQGGVETTTHHYGSTGETFLVETPCINLPSDYVEESHASEDCSPTDRTVDSHKTYNLTTGAKHEEISNMTLKRTYLSLSLNSSKKTYLQKNESPIKVTNRFMENHEIKMFTGTVSLQRSHSFSALPVNQRPTNIHQNCEDAFEKMYTELCSPKMQKSFKFSDICRKPRKSSELHTSGFSASSKFHEGPKDAFESMYQTLCSEGFPKTPTFLRAENLKKKYGGVYMSNTVSALVNSPLRTVPAIDRIKRAANFCSEDFQPSPIKRLKNIPENSSYRICQKLPCWKNQNLQKTDVTFTLYAPSKNDWPSDEDSGFSVSSNNNFLISSATGMKESRVADVDENFPKCLHRCISLRKSQNSKVEASKNPSYNDGRMRGKNDSMEELVYKGYQTFLKGHEGKILDF